MSPTADVGVPVRSTSSIIADTTRGYHILKINGYSLTKATPTGEYIKSHLFTIGGHRWFIRYYPNGYTSDWADYVSLFLILDKRDGKVVKQKAQYNFSFADKVRGVDSILEEIRSFKSTQGWGHPDFIKREDLEKSKHVKDDSFSVRCDIAVVNEFRTREVESAVQEDIPVFISVPPSDLQQCLADLLHTEKGADVVFQVGAETFAVHRCVLAIRSPVFSAELFGSMKESGAGVVCVDDMEPKVFKALLYFVYTDLLPVTLKEDEEEEEEDDVVMSQHLLVAADRYNLERLKLMCADKLCKYIDAGTVSTILALAEQHQCSGLKKACFGFLKSPENLKAVVSSEGFKHLSRSCPTVMEELVVMLGT